ncbi:MAG TPA: hypothetical protein V6D33_02175 [Cyanophyceae cyanobacterium]
MSEIAIVVLSCDRYSDLWQPFFSLFWQNWSDCPFPIYLLSNYQSFSDRNVISVPIGEDLSWSKGLKQILEQISTPYTLLFLEDFFLLSPVDNARVLSCFETLRKLEGDMLRLKPDPPPNQPVQGFPEIGRIGMDAFFRISTQTALWRREFLLNLLQENESAWEFEVNASDRSRDLGNGLYCTWQPVFHYSHVIEKGKWFRWAAKRFGDMDIGCDLSRRPVMTIADSLKWNYVRVNGQLRMRVLQSLSWEQRQQLRKLKAKFSSLA